MSASTTAFVGSESDSEGESSSGEEASAAQPENGTANTIAAEAVEESSSEEEDEETPSAEVKARKRPAAEQPASEPPAKRTKVEHKSNGANGTNAVENNNTNRPVGSVILEGINHSWSSLNVSENTRRSIENLGFERMMEVQAKAIPLLLAGKDVIGAAKTGSGKTLAFVIPAIELLVKTQFKPRNGTGVLVISPVRELAIQIYGVVRQMMEGFHTQSYGIVIGGASKQAESKKLAKGVNFLVATPGRLLDHLTSTRGFNVKGMLALIIDEADRILEIGFEEEIKKILNLVPKDRQTMLFSATQTKRTKDLIKLSFRTKPVMVDVAAKSDTSTRAGLQQGYVVVEQAKKFLLLFSFLKRNKKKKIIVFLSTCKAVKFYSELLNYIDLPVLELHGQLKQKKRTTTFFEFVNIDRGALLCTNVAARGLDIPAVDWIIQFDPADDPREYIHRVGRTARGISGQGKALLFLLPQEVTYLKHLRRNKVQMSEYDFPQKKIANVQAQLEDLISKTYHLHRLAREAYRSFLQGYAQQNPKIFNVHSLDLRHVAKCFGFSVPPSVDLQISHRAKKQKNKKKKGKFSSDNPYGA